MIFTYIFVANIFLIFLDATVGYHAAPSITLLAGGGEQAGEEAVRGVRRLLAWVVALYMFFDCLAFFGQRWWLLYFTTAVLAVDVAAQLFIVRKMMNRRGR
ncbi:hypothetical protein [Citrifermentans bremense]|uniref:hypothetical protein n=1 Tax=Citrifermentans bremense TaxID=60035 RepID=UPI000415DC76|nr:hypothetical protein [Citrifermentans bremense]